MSKNINWGKDIHPNSSYNSTKHIAEIGLNSGKNLYICLICNKSLDGDESIFSSNHDLCSSHKEHLKTLFYKCIPSNVDVNRNEKFAKLITNSMFDISICLSDQTSSLLHRYENHIVCMFCQDIVCYCQDDTVKDDIINHLQSDSHINNVKNNATWVYQLETSSGFLMLHKTVTFCSICDKLLYAQENDTLHSAVDHLLTEHQTELNKSESDPCSIIDDSDEFESSRQNDSESSSSVCPIYDSWEEILLNEETSQESYSIHKKSNNVTKKEHSFQNELEDQDTRMELAKTGSECASNLEKIPHRVVQCAREHLVTLDNDEFELVCPECKETVEMYNDDPELSMDLHSEKHKDISEINNLFNTNLAFYNNSEYPCPSCQENVHIFNKNIQLSLSLHVCNGDKHLSNRCENFINYNASTVFDHLPDFLRVHRGFFQLDRTNFRCTLCNCTFDLPSSLDKAREDVLMHLTDQYHNKQFQLLSQDPWNLLSKDNKLDNVLLLESVIEENKQYVEKCERYYFCKACKCCFLTFGNDQEMMQLFAMHCLCKNHKKKFKRYIEERNWEDKKYEQENNDTGNNESYEHTSPATQTNNDKDFFKRFYNLPAYQLNSLFLVLEGNSVRCKLCKISISCSQINQVRKHCYSESHSMILVQSASNYIARHENKHFVNTSDPRNSKFINAVKKLSISNYRINDHTVTPHLLFIDNDGNNFVCLICNTRIAFSVDCSYLLKHFTTKGHKLKIFNLSLDVAEIGLKLNELDSHVSSNNFCVKENDFFGKPNETDNIDDVSRLFEKLPSEHSIYKDFIKKDGRNLTCLLCGCSLLSRQTFEEDLKRLQDHFSNSLHREQYKLYTAGPISNDKSVNQDPWEKFNDCSNVELLAERRCILNSNSQHLKKENCYFMCCICDEYFVFFDEEDMKNTFASHCLTTAHSRKLKKKQNKSKKNNCIRLSESKTLQLNAQSIANHPEDCHISKDLEPISGSWTLCYLRDQHMRIWKKNRVDSV
ncbi:uncharacterized protein LOC128985006 [Macrosteles quadrilineatus]|uniref:uncharacterized protein LOC128985006 n=1 Tax=Macrosteles quadrilineatus TaxID=74068 RepID=UPI0023E29104|nr:uncharacterized protein LOC128985006 [Macrosteles quadrilineatus]